MISAASVLNSTQSHNQDSSTQREARERHRGNVRSMIKSAGQTDPEFVLIASLIFASCELVTGALDAGMVHLEAGSKILKERIAYLAQNHLHHSLSASMLSEHILPIFAAYSQITSTFGIELVPIGDPSTAWCAQYDSAQVPTVFVTTDQAYAHLKSTIHQIFTTNSLRSPAQVEQLQMQLDRWIIALNALEHCQKPDDTQHVNSSLLYFLRNQHRLAQVFLSVACNREEVDSPPFEKFSLDFVWILAQYDSMNFDKTLANENVELIPPLFIIATKTTSKAIRKEALRLLKAMERVEANWDSLAALGIARELIAYEERSNPPLALSGRCRPMPSPNKLILKRCLHKVSGTWVSTDIRLCITDVLTISI